MIERQRVPDVPPRVDYYSPSRLERIARELDAEPWELRDFLRQLVDERSRARAAAHEGAHTQLDRRVERAVGGPTQ